VTPRTASGLLKFRPIRPGSRIALVAPASGFERAEFDAGVAELCRLGFEPVWDDAIFERTAITAGRPGSRATSFMRAMTAMEADAVISVRGGYGSVEILPLLDADRLRRTRTAFVGYSDVTSLHAYLSGTVGLASVHGAMIEGRIAKGAAAYDAATLLASLSCDPVGELRPVGLQTLSMGEATGPFTGGTLTQVLAALATPYDFEPPGGHVLFLDEVNERPYRLHRMLMQLRLSGRLSRAAAVVFGELPGCDEPGGRVTAREIVADVLADFPGPVLIGFPSGHTVSPALSVPLGVRTTVVGDGARPRLVFEEAAAA
jgi:muramoyltetrapeptide carboxypeptidase